MNQFEWDLAHELEDAIRCIYAIAQLNGLERDQHGNYVMTGTPIGESAIDRAYDTEVLGIELEYTGRSVQRIMKTLEERLEWDEPIDDGYPKLTPEEEDAIHWAELRREKARYRAE